MAHRVPEDDLPEVVQRLETLLKEVSTLRERIDTAQAEDRRRQQLPYVGPDRRKDSRLDATQATPASDDVP